MPVPYVGAGNYCYANSLSMVLAAARPGSVFDPGVIEVVSTMPFGAVVVDRDEEPFSTFNPVDVTPDEGIDRALRALDCRWECSRPATADAALAAITTALESGPVLAGPLDAGDLAYNPQHHLMAGSDHFVAVLEIDDGLVRLHDPYGFPWAALSVDRFLRAWQKVGRRQHERSGGVVAHGEPFTLRANCEPRRHVPAAEAIEWSLPLIREALRRDGGGGGVWHNGAAMRRLAEIVERRIPRGWAELAITFSLPLASRRATDAARLLVDLAPEAAAALERQARWFGVAEHLAVTFDRVGLARAFRHIGALYDELGAI